MTALDAADPAAMLRHFFNSCFQKRSDRLHPKSSHFEGSDETDGSGPTPVSLQTTAHSSNLPIRERPKAPAREQAEADTQTPATQTPTMPKPAKKTKSTTKSVKDRKPYLRVQQATRYFAEAQDNDANKAVGSAAKIQLNQMFDELIPEEQIKRDESGKVINTEIGPLQSMDYIQRLGVNIATYEQFVVLEIVQAETLGTITRKGFVDGWAQVVVESNGKVTCDWSSQKRLVQSRINRTLTDRDYYKVYYDFAFQIGREPSQKAINMALAVGLWEGLFDPTTHPWRSAHVNWLEAWADYLKEKFGVTTVNEEGEEEIEYKRTVSKDLWAQTRLFAAKTMEDETLSFWSEEQAWPGLIDEFVVWCREKGIAVAKNGERMEVEE